MILGIGVDIIEIDRIENACKREHFKNKVYTKKELTLLRIDSLAGNFATKEAVSKALGSGFRHFSLIDIEVLRDKFVKPYVVLYNNALKAFEMLNAKKIHVSISHTKQMAISYVIIES